MVAANKSKSIDPQHIAAKTGSEVLAIVEEPDD
jgi:hypothetical protein